MDVNAVYWGDDDFSGSSADLGGPLNMNGSGSRFEGERIQWDDALELSRPGLRGEGEDKETFLQAGETLSIDLPDVSLDDIDFFGIRATSVNGGDSIKGVSGNPEDMEPEPEPEAATYSKVFFASNLNDDGLPIGGLAVLGPDEEPQDGVQQLDADTEGTFADYVAFFVDFGFPEIGDIESIVFSDDDAEVFRIDAPESGFADADALLAAYDAAIDEMQAEGEAVSGLQIGVLGSGEGWQEDPDEAATDESDRDDAALAAL